MGVFLHNSPPEAEECTGMHRSGYKDKHIAQVAGSKSTYSMAYTLLRSTQNGLLNSTLLLPRVLCRAFIMQQWHLCTSKKYFEVLLFVVLKTNHKVPDWRPVEIRGILDSFCTTICNQLGIYEPDMRHKDSAYGSFSFKLA